MHAEHYVYFALKSEQVSAAEITARLGLEPDSVSVLGSKRNDPPRPACHIWAIECRTSQLTVDEQIDRVLERLLQAADLIGQLTTELDHLDQCQVSAVLQVVRHYGDDPDSPGNTDQPAQPNLLGWHLDSRAIGFLARTHAELDVDEYGN